MCGIAGIVDFRRATEAHLVQRMCDAMRHRGPDDQGVYVHEGVGLGARRLSIIDVDGGHQPVFNEDRSIVVVMNGEIYNFPELRRELTARGHRFRSRVDTEVLAHLYEEHGDHLVHRLRGMFAFGLWDARRRRLLCARDRIGKKPLFWAWKDGRAWFASEVRALLEDPALGRSPDVRALVTYLTLHYVPHPLSAFEGIHKLPPASTMVIDGAGPRIARYWALDHTRKLALTPPEAEEQLRAHIDEATRIRLMSDVPLGALLSGGIDSSAVVAAMAGHMAEPVKTFSIGFPDAAFDEVRYARMVAERFSTDHHEFVVEPTALEIMPTLARHYGEPYADPSAIPTFYLAELTSRHVTVALNGDGGDESFAGYTRYVSNDMASHLNWLPRPLQKAAPAVAGLVGRGAHDAGTRNRIRRLALALGLEPAERYAMWMSAFDAERRADLLHPDLAAELGDWRPDAAILDTWASLRDVDRVDRMLAVDVETYLPGDLLVKMDIATMAYSVEARSPFLDHELMEFAAALPADLKLRGMAGKRILKAALRGTLPDEVLDRPKMGFGVPLARWFRKELRGLPSAILLDPATVARGYFRPQAVERLIADHRTGRADHSMRLWALLALEMWHREVVEAPTQLPSAA